MFPGSDFTRPSSVVPAVSPAVRHEKTLGLIAAKKTGGDAALGDATGLATEMQENGRHKVESMSL